VRAPLPWCWFAHLVEPAADALAQAPAVDAAGMPAGVLAAWAGGRRPDRGAVRMDARVVDPVGACAWASLVLLPAGRAPLFDDPAVSAALRAVLAGPAAEAVTTFVRDATHFAGALTVRRPDPEGSTPADGPTSSDRNPFRRIADPFGRLGPAEVLQVGAGLFGTVPAPPGPVIQRYAGQPWPVPGFPGAAPARS
jgi:hypothetical protein